MLLRHPAVFLSVPLAVFCGVCLCTAGPPEEPRDKTPGLDRLGTWKARAALPPFPDRVFSIAEDEVIALVGGGNLERIGKHGCMEAALQETFRSRRPRFRWMSGEADTVYEQAREMNFGSWTGQLEWAGATTVICHFGQMESLDGAARIPEFIAAYHRLLDQFAPVTSRIVLIAPFSFLKADSPLVPDLSKQNETVRRYAAAVRQIAVQRQAVFIDLFAAEDQPAGITSSGRIRSLDAVHPDEAGIFQTGRQLAGLLGAVLPPVTETQNNYQLVRRKNRLWADCWRPANWAFAYGDRTWAVFGQPDGGAPFLKESFAENGRRMAALEKLIDEGRHEAGPEVGAPAARESAASALTVDDELKSFTAADGFEVSLFAGESLGVVKPIQISWDERGRMFVACSPMYPHLEPGQEPADYILCCEDTDGDGKADKTWKCVEGLTMTQGMEPGAGGLYVCDFTELAHYRDTDGDGKYETRETILAGFGTGDTHQLINSVCHGEDGSLWMTQGLHINSRVETPHGIVKLEKAGVWRFDPKSWKLEPFFNGAKAGHNCWGVAFTDDGQPFHKTGDRPQGYWCLPGMIPQSIVDEYHDIGGIFHTNPKTTALDFIGTAAMPEDLQGCALIAGFMGSLVEVQRLHNEGAGYRTELLPRLLTSTWEGFRPVDVGVGPDGAIYVCDWCNPVIGHYQASYRDPKRDKTHGRIWRLAAKGRAKVIQPDLAGMNAAALTQQLRSPERWTRYQARRLLAGLPKAEVIEATDAVLSDEAKRPAGPDIKLLRELLGVRQAHRSVPKMLLGLLLRDNGPAAANVISRLADCGLDGNQAAQLVAARIADPDARVRLGMIVACANLPSPATVRVIADLMRQPRDKFIDYALRQALRYTAGVWRTEEAAGRPIFKTAEDRAFAEAAAGADPDAAKPRGQIIYETLCLNCHQADGKGLPGIYPPIGGSDWVTGNPDRLTKILLHGLTGPVTVNGQPFVQAAPIPMPPAGLTDEQIADVLTWVRATWGNGASGVSPESVGKLRAAHPDRVQMWTEEELGGR